MEATFHLDGNYHLVLDSNQIRTMANGKNPLLSEISSFLNQPGVNGMLMALLRDPTGIHMNDVVAQLRLGQHGNAAYSTSDVIGLYAQNGRVFDENSGVRYATGEMLQNLMKAVTGLDLSSFNTGSIYLPKGDVYSVQTGGVNFQPIQVISFMFGGTTDDYLVQYQLEQSQAFSGGYLFEDLSGQLQSAELMQVWLQLNETTGQLNIASNWPFWFTQDYANATFIIQRMFEQMNSFEFNGFLKTEYAYTFEMDPRYVLAANGNVERNDWEALFKKYGRTLDEGPGIQAMTGSSLDALLRKYSLNSLDQMEFYQNYTNWLPDEDLYFSREGGVTYQRINILDVKYETYAIGYEYHVWYTAEEGDDVFYYQDEAGRPASAKVMYAVFMRGKTGEFTILGNEPDANYAIPGQQEPDAEELERKVNEFLNTEGLNGLLFSSFRDPRGASIWDAVAQFRFGTSDPSALFSKYNAQYSRGLSFGYVPKASLDELLLKYTGHVSDEYRGFDLSLPFYFPEEDLYALQPLDSRYEALKAAEIVRGEDGTITVRYRAASGEPIRIFFAGDRTRDSAYAEAEQMVATFHFDSQYGLVIDSNQIDILTSGKNPLMEEIASFLDQPGVNALLLSAMLDPSAARMSNVVAQLQLGRHGDTATYSMSDVSYQYYLNGRTFDENLRVGYTTEEMFRRLLKAVTGRDLSEFNVSALALGASGLYAVQFAGNINAPISPLWLRTDSRYGHYIVGYEAKRDEDSGLVPGYAFVDLDGTIRSAEIMQVCIEFDEVTGQLMIRTNLPVWYTEDNDYANHTYIIQRIFEQMNRFDFNGFLKSEYDHGSEFDPRYVLAANGDLERNDWEALFKKYGKTMGEGPGIQAMTGSELDEWIYHYMDYAIDEMDFYGKYQNWFPEEDIYFSREGGVTYQRIRILDVEFNRYKVGYEYVVWYASEDEDGRFYYQDRDGKPASAEVMKLYFSRGDKGQFYIYSNEPDEEYQAPGQEPTWEELKQKVDEFLMTPGINGLLRSSFRDPRGASLYNVIYQLKDGSFDVPAIFAKYGVTWYNDMGESHTTREALDKLLLRTTGHTADEFEGFDTRQYYYFPDEELYVIQHGDTNAQMLKHCDLELGDDGSIIVWYERTDGQPMRVFFGGAQGQRNNVVEAQQMVAVFHYDSHYNLVIDSNRIAFMGDQSDPVVAELNAFLNEPGFNGFLLDAKTTPADTDMSKVVRQMYGGVYGNHGNFSYTDAEIRALYRQNGRQLPQDTGIRYASGEVFRKMLKAATGLPAESFRLLQWYLPNGDVYTIDSGGVDNTPLSVIGYRYVDDEGIIVYYQITPDTPFWPTFPVGNSQATIMQAYLKFNETTKQLNIVNVYPVWYEDTAGQDSLKSELQAQMNEAGFNGLLQAQFEPYSEPWPDTVIRALNDATGNWASLARANGVTLDATDDIRATSGRTLKAFWRQYLEKRFEWSRWFENYPNRFATADIYFSHFPPTVSSILPVRIERFIYDPAQEGYVVLYTSTLGGWAFNDENGTHRESRTMEALMRRGSDGSFVIVYNRPM